VKNNWPDNFTIQQYLEGSLDKKLMHELEKRALEDPFLADALEGFAQTTNADHGLSILQRQLHERIVHQQENKKVFDLTWQRLSIAAAAAVMFISAGVLFWMNSQVDNRTAAANRQKVEVNVVPVDTLANDGAVVSNTDKIPAVTEPVVKAQRDEGLYATKPTVKSKLLSVTQGSERSNATVLSQLEDTLNHTGDGFIADKEARIAAMEVEKSDRARSAKVSSEDLKMKTLNSAPVRLSEVAVSRFAPSVAGNAVPASGWEAYRRYVQESIAKASGTIGQKGKVIVGFKVAEDGNLRDVKILKGLSATADSLALEIIRTGPSWKAAADGKASDLKVDLDF